MNLDKYKAWQTAKSEGDTKRATRLRDQLIAENMGLCSMVLRRFKTRLAGDREDLIQAGAIGLMIALDRYDESKGAFSTFATWRIFHEMQKYNGKSDVVHRPRYLNNAKHRDTAPDFFKFVSIQPRTYEDNGAAWAHRNGLQLTAEQGEIAEQERFEIWKDLAPAFDKLTPREREVVFAVVWQELPFGEIGLRLNLTKQRVCQIYEEATSKMRNFLEAFTDDYPELH